jgi:hypothetical protein
MNIQELEQKMLSHGDNNIRLVRVNELGGSARAKFLGNILISLRHFREGNDEIFSVRVNLVANIASRSNTMGEKLSINKFEAYINHSERTIRLGPTSGAQLEENLQNYGIGTYAFNWLLAELKRLVPNYGFNPFEVTLPETMTISAKERLMAFFTKFGINFNFVDLEQRSGTLRANTPTQIMLHYNSDKIQELDLEEYLFSLIVDRHKYETEISKMKAEIERMGEESFAGIPKKQLVKYTLIACGFTILFILVLIV